jgi:hypothetical protein
MDGSIHLTGRADRPIGLNLIHDDDREELPGQLKEYIIVHIHI